MRSLRTLSAIAFAALLTLIGAGPAAAAKKPKASAFAAKYHLTGSWKTKDTDKDGLKNLKEFKLGTNPKSADTDKDGLKDADEVESGNDPTDRDTDGDGTKDGAEHAGVITAFDGETITIKRVRDRQEGHRDPRHRLHRRGRRDRRRLLGRRRLRRHR